MSQLPPNATTELMGWLVLPMTVPVCPGVGVGVGAVVAVAPAVAFAVAFVFAVGEGTCVGVGWASVGEGVVVIG